MTSPKARRRHRWIAGGAITAVVVLVAGTAAAWYASHPEDALKPVTPEARPIQPVGGLLKRALRVGATSAPVTHRPTTPPARICGDASILNGPSTPPAGAIVVPAGNNGSVYFSQPGATYWFAPGVHTLGSDIYAQIVPGDNSSFVGAPGAIIDGQNRNLYAFTQRATNVAIRHLTIRNFGTGLSNNNEGVVNHDAGESWTIEFNTVTANDGAGVFVGDGNVIRSNCLKDNGQYGLSAYELDGVNDIVIDHNEIAHNNTDDWERRIDGCGCTGGAKFWDVDGASITNNYVHSNLSVGLWADTNNRDFVVEGNWFEANQDEAFWYEISYNARIRFNTFFRNTLVKGQQYANRDDNFPVAALYLSEAGGDSRVAGNGVIDVSYNFFLDNWSAVTLWENADRFCNSPANTSTDSCTLNSAASLSRCVAGTINRQPYYSDCRWKTQNVAVHHNEFRVTPSAIGCTSWCARQAVISNYGTYPSWSPYMGDVVRTAITFNQNNRWYSNTYAGPWTFMAFETGRTLDWNAWRAGPYSQDAGSTIS